MLGESHNADAVVGESPDSEVDLYMKWSHPKTWVPHQHGLRSRAERMRKIDQQEQLHEDGFDKWHDASVVGMLSTTDVDDSDDDKVDSHEAVERFFAQPQKTKPKKNDIMAGLFHNALQMTQNKNRHVVPKRTTSVGTKHNHVKITPVHKKAASDTKPASEGLHKYKKAHRHSKLDKLEAKIKSSIANEMKKPLDEDGSEDRLPLTIVHHSSSSASAASAAVHAAAKAVGTLKALKASAERGVTRANHHLKALRSEESPSSSIMREAKKSAKKTLARLQKKEDEEYKARAHKHEASVEKDKLVIPMEPGIESLTTLTARFLEHPVPHKVGSDLHPLPKSWQTSEDLTIEPEDKVATVKQLVGDTLDIEDFQ